MVLYKSVINIFFCVFILKGINFVSCNDQSNLYSTILTQNSYDAVVYCNSTGAALFCRDNSSDVDLEVCYYCANGTCFCSAIPNGGMVCQYGSVYILDGYCATYDYVNDFIIFGKCMYNCRTMNQRWYPEYSYTKLPQNISELNSTMCGGSWNRERTLCGRCRHGYYPMPYSYNISCVKCAKARSLIHWLYLSLFVSIPLTIFCFALMLLKVNVTSSFLHGFVLFGQAISMPAIYRVIWLASDKKPMLLSFVRFIGSFYSLWNFDILRTYSPNICIHSNTFDILEIDLAIAFYALSLLYVVRFVLSLYDRKFKPLVILWKPFKKVLKMYHSNWNIKTSLVDSFVTFLLLSSGKILNVSFDTLTPVKVYRLLPSKSTSFNYHWGIYNDASTPLFAYNSQTVLAFAVLIIFIIFPMILLLIYPFRCFHKCLNNIPLQWQALHTFMDSFQGGFKNGVDPHTQDCRWFSSLFLLFRFLIFLIYALTLSSVFFCFAPILAVLVVILVIVIQPFKIERDNYINSGFLLLLSAWYVGAAGVNLSQMPLDHMNYLFYGICGGIAVLPIVFLTLLSLHWLNKHKMFIWKFSKQYRKVPTAANEKKA